MACDNKKKQDSKATQLRGSLYFVQIYKGLDMSSPYRKILLLIKLSIVNCHLLKQFFRMPHTLVGTGLNPMIGSFELFRSFGGFIKQFA